MLRVKKRPRIYDEGQYHVFGEQPNILEIRIGYALIPLVDKTVDAPLMKELQYLRNQFDAEYGLPTPPIRICDDIKLNPYQYSFYIHGTEVATADEVAKPGYYLCMDTGYVDEPVDCKLFKNVKDPAFDMDGFLVPEEEIKDFNSRGYVCVEPENVIKAHLHETIRKNITRILNQSMVNNLIDKVRGTNPDVIADVFFTKDFPISDMKILLNRLLSEEISIRDMNTILETIAEYLNEERNPIKLAEKVREHLAYNFVQSYADNNKVVHIFRLSEKLNDFLSENIYTPKSKIEIPYFSLKSDVNRKLAAKISKAISESKITERGYCPVFACISDLRIPLAEHIHFYLPGVKIVSDKELYAVNKDLSFKIEGEISLDEEE